jgi:hypothetical protein
MSDFRRDRKWYKQQSIQIEVYKSACKWLPELINCKWHTYCYSPCTPFLQFGNWHVVSEVSVFQHVYILFNSHIYEPVLNKTVGLLHCPFLLTFCFLVLASSSVLYSCRLWIFILGIEHFISGTWHQKAEGIFHKSTDNVYTCKKGSIQFSFCAPPPPPHPNEDSCLKTGKEPDLL